MLILKKKTRPNLNQHDHDLQNNIIHEMAQKLKEHAKERTLANCSNEPVFSLETINSLIDEVTCEFSEETEEQYDER